MVQRVTLILLTLSFLVPGPARAGRVDVEVHDDFFAPDNVGNQIGDTVRFFSAGTNDTHNVREDGELFDSGLATMLAFTYDVVFSAGTFHYYCEIHGSPSGGMDGFVRIPVRINRAPDGLPFTVRWAAVSSETGSVYDVQFKVGSGDWRRWKRDTTGFSGVFGRNGNPVRVRDGVRYSFRARSQEGDVVSRWSPVRRFTP
jgi:plastocyanin